MNKDQVEKYIYGLYKWAFGELDPNYDPNKDVHPQPIYRRHEFAEAAEYLMSFKDALVAEFLQGQTLADVIKTKGRNVMQKQEDRASYIPSADDVNPRFHDAVTEILRTPADENGITKANPEGWKNIEFKYHDPYNNVRWDIDSDYASRNFPTAYKLIQEYGDDCPIASYSYMAPGTILHRHTGPENRDGDFIRVHIPLIIPPGDVFFEVDGEEIDWSDIFAFDNQLVHSAHNLTNEHRLIFLIDIRRTRIGLPQGYTWNKDRQLYSLLKPFERKPK